MWVNIQCKVSLKTKGDYGKSIIYTSRELETEEVLIITEVHILFLVEYLK
jgi:hypothetical protein